MHKENIEGTYLNDGFTDEAQTEIGIRMCSTLRNVLLKK